MSGRACMCGMDGTEQVRLRTPAVPCLCAITKEPVAAPGRGTSTGGATVGAEPAFDFYVMVVTSDAVVHYYRLDVVAGGECRLGKVGVVMVWLASVVYLCPARSTPSSPLSSLLT